MLRRSIRAVRRRGLLLFASAIGTMMVPVGPSICVPVDPLRYVDPFIGTGGHGHTFPGPSLPFGMIQPGPDTRLEGWDGCSGYHGSDRRLFGFSHTHLSGTGASDYGDILLLPATGEIRWSSGWGRAETEGYGSRFRKDRERASAGYYAVTLDDYGTRAELTTTLRAAMHRYTFPAGAPSHVLVDLAHRDEVIEAHLKVLGDREIEGLRRSRAWARDQRVFFAARFSKPFSALLAVDDRPREGLVEASGRNIKAALRFRADETGPLLVKIGISAVSAEGARRNLQAEIPGWDFDAVHDAAREAWRTSLARMEIEGGSEEERTIFYTALYHALLQPNLFTDVDGRYRGMDGKIHDGGGSARYTVFSLWDTFRAAHPLYTILEPARTTEFLRTFLGQYDEGGLLPVWELAGNETMCMIGYHAVSVIADAWAKGIRGFDAEKALDAMKASAEKRHLGLDAYMRFGFIPGDLESESVSKTLEYAYDDWCIATLAGALGRTNDRARYLRRSQAWKNLLDPATGFVRPKLSGAFKSPFDPREVDVHYTEANAWQYAFFVPHDVEGHIRALGGREAYLAKLEGLFEAPSATTGRDQADITGLIGQYAHGNEPSHHVAYLFTFADAPARTQRLVRRIREDLYHASPDGLAGNEDCGQMSAWYVLSALGFYSVTPGTDVYVIGAPLFPRATIRLENGRSFTIRAEGASRERPYIVSAALNGAPIDRSYLRHGEIIGGGELVFRFGAAPSATWGIGPGKRPPSAVRDEVILPVPFVATGDRIFRDRTTVALASPDPGATIRCTRDGGEPAEDSPGCAAPMTLQETTTLLFRAWRPGFPATPVQEARFRKLEGNRSIALAPGPDPQYATGGRDTLIDGVRGGDDFRLGTWLGFQGSDLEARVDLGAETEVRRIAIGLLQDQGSWIFMPLSVAFETSRDGIGFEEAGEAVNDVDPRAEGPVRKEFAVSFDPRPARYVRLRARATRECPSWHKGAGRPSWLFADEVLVD